MSAPIDSAASVISLNGTPVRTIALFRWRGVGYRVVSAPTRRRSNRKGHVMSATDKAKNKVDELAGKAKEKLGEATGDRDKKNEGKGQQVESNLKDAGEKVKDAFKD